MKNVIVVYCNTNEKDFENIIPLLFVGKRNQKLGLSNDFEVLFSNGYDNLSNDYKDSLKAVGFKIHDVSPIYDELEKQYPILSQKFSDYSKKTFLQWLVIDKFFDGEPIIDYDGDIVFNEDPKIIAEKLKGKTFILQGCPAFTVVSNREWFRQYKHHLDLFTKDLDGYCEKAWEQRPGWEVTFKTRWAGSRFSKIFMHDQDLQSHLIHTGQLIQDNVEDIMFALQDYAVFENPLFIHMYDDNFPFTCKRENGIDYFIAHRQDAEKCVYKKKVLFWHMQNCFNFYLSKFIARKRILPFFTFNRLSLDLQCTSYEGQINRFLKRFTNFSNRLFVYDYFFNKHNFSTIFKNSVWWKQGVFK